MSEKYTIQTDRPPLIIERALERALEWGDRCCENDEEQWFVEDEGAREMLAELRANLAVTRRMNRH